MAEASEAVMEVAQDSGAAPALGVAMAAMASAAHREAYQSLSTLTLKPWQMNSSICQRCSK